MSKSCKTNSESRKSQPASSFAQGECQAELQSHPRASAHLSSSQMFNLPLPTYHSFKSRFSDCFPVHNQNPPCSPPVKGCAFCHSKLQKFTLPVQGSAQNNLTGTAASTQLDPMEEPGERGAELLSF